MNERSCSPEGYRHKEALLGLQKSGDLSLFFKRKNSGDITTDVFQHLPVTLTPCIHNFMHDIVERRLQLPDAS